MGQSCRTLLWDTLVGNSCGTLLWALLWTTTTISTTSTTTTTTTADNCSLALVDASSSATVSMTASSKTASLRTPCVLSVKSPKPAFRTRLPPKVTRQVSKTSVCFALPSGTAPRKRTFHQSRANPNGTATSRTSRRHTVCPDTRSKRVT